MMTLKEYLDAVSKLTGTKLKMGNPVTRAAYEELSIKAGRWITAEEFNAHFGM